ncbi:MAG: V-type ATPase subunit [Chloroflexi bacterium]|nr:V-type ATPase subunit [Chloroflexota bacterium]MCL5275399.1 V-type ATPase subunit [Chloroflexota bacterium]
MPGTDVTRYAAIHARVRAMYAGLLTEQMWVALSEASDLGGLVSLLKETTYGPYLLKVEDRALTPRRAVYQIKSRLADAFTTVVQLVPAQTRPLLTQLYRHFEVANLKAVLRGIMTGASWDQVRYVLFPLGSLTVLPAQAMVEAGNVTGAVELLRGTPYYETLSHAMPRFITEQSLFPLEVALDLNYWRQLWTSISRLGSQDRAQALRVVGALLDMNNVMWAIRYRVYHNLSEEEVINYTLPFGYRVRDEDIRAIAAGADIPRIITRIYPGLSGVDVLLHELRSGLPQLELQLQRHVAEQCRSAFTGYPFHIGVPLAFVVLHELEIQDLTVLIEAKSAQMPAEEFKAQLLMA